VTAKHSSGNIAFAHFFESLGYGVTFEGKLDTGERWHEIYDEGGLICQIAFGTPLAEFLADLPHFLENNPGIGPTVYWCAFVDDEKLRKLLACVQSAKDLTRKP
jgi:hypothetical protein